MAIYGNFSSPMFQLQQQIQEMTTFSNLIETTEYRYISESFISTIVGKLRKLFDKFLGFLKDRFENLKAKLKKRQFEFRYIKLRKKLDDPAKDKTRFHETLYYVVPGSDFSFFDQLKPFSFFEECAFNNIFAKPLEEINVSSLERFEAGSEVDAAALLAAGVLSKCEYGFKVLGNGSLTKSLTVKASAFSESAKQKIEAVGGKAEVV